MPETRIAVLDEDIKTFIARHDFRPNTRASLEALQKVTKVYELCRYTESSLLAKLVAPHKALTEIKDALAADGLTLGMHI